MGRTFYKQTANDEIVHFTPIGEVVWYGILWLIGYSFLLLAFLNLLVIRPMTMGGTIASLLWIGLMGGGIAYDCRRIGVRQHLINGIGSITRNRFVRVTTDEAGDAIISFGFMLGTHPMHFLVLRADGITEIDWGMGQASDMAGTDLNDWHVAVWYRADAILYNREDNKIGIYIVGPSGNVNISRSLAMI